MLFLEDSQKNAKSNTKAQGREIKSILAKISHDKPRGCPWGSH